MKIITLLLSLLFSIHVSSGQKKPEEIYKSQRVEKLINSQWTFNYFPVETEGKIRVQTWVKNENSRKNNCILQTSIYDASKKLVQVIKTNAVINPQELYKFDQTS